MRSVYHSVWIVLCAILCVVAVRRNAAAEDATSFQNPTGWSIGDANSTYQEWDVFSGISGNVPDVGIHFPASFTPTFSATSSALVTTSSHNFYWYDGDYQWKADIDNYGVGGFGEGTRVIVQTAATLYEGVGVYPDSLAIVRQLDWSSILGGDNADALRETVLFEGPIVLGGNPVTTQERLWEFYLPGYFDDFRVVGTSNEHSNLMQVQVDSMIVPEPAAIVLFGTGLIVFGVCRIIRRTRRRPRSV